MLAVCPSCMFDYGEMMPPSERRTIAPAPQTEHEPTGPGGVRESRDGGRTYQEGNCYAAGESRDVEPGRLVARDLRRLPSPDGQQHDVALDMDGEVCCKRAGESSPHRCSPSDVGRQFK